MRRTNLKIVAMLILLLGLLPRSVVSAESSQVVPPLTSVQIPAAEAPSLEALLTVKDLILQYHSKGVPVEELYEGAIKGMFESLGDPYSSYLTEDQMRNLSSSLEGEYIGIGVRIEDVGGEITVVGVFDDSPAQEGGMRARDVILAVDGKPLTGKTVNDAGRLLRGEAGTSVRVRVRDTATGAERDVELFRRRISPPSLEFRELGNGQYYIRIPEFSSAAARDFGVVMDFVRSRGGRGLLLDLRDNPGGLLDAAIAVAERLVPNGPVLELRGKNARQVIKSGRDTIPIPTVVLVNGGTASASEIVAGAVRDRGVGILVGEPTFGKGSVQTIVKVEGLPGGIRLTTADYCTPSGASLAGVGLPPDIPVSASKVAAPPELSLIRSLGEGAVGLDVLALQQLLTFLGYDLGEPDGVFGPRTARVLADFSERNQHEYSRKVTAETARELNKALRAREAQTPDPVFEQGKTVLDLKVRTGWWR